jgi:hypothetical protein
MALGVGSSVGSAVGSAVGYAVGSGVAFVSGAAAPHAQRAKMSAKTNARASSFFLIISHSY